MKFGVVGSRTFKDYPYLQKILGWFECKQIISGGAKGADSLARLYAAENNISYKEFLPNWDRDGKSAGYKRNMLIVQHSDELIAFWDGSSKGTAHSIELAESAGKAVHIFWPTDDDLLEGVGVQ